MVCVCRTAFWARSLRRAARSAGPVAAFSCRARVKAAQLTQAPHGVGEVRRPDPGLGPQSPAVAPSVRATAGDADGSHKCAARLNGPRAKERLDPDPQDGFGPVAVLGLPGQRLAPLALAMAVAGQFSGFERRFDLGRPPGGIRPDNGTDGGARSTSRICPPRAMYPCRARYPPDCAKSASTMPARARPSR